MRLLSFAMPLFAALPLHAETLSAEVGRTGLAATEARLSALPSPTDAERFALGGILFLRGFEVNFQERRKTGLTTEEVLGPSFIDASILPPDPNNHTFILPIYRQVASKMILARDALSAIPADSGFEMQVELADLWFDVNENSTREPDEGLVKILDAASGHPFGLPQAVHFDVADAAFLASQADVYSYCESVLDSRGLPDKVMAIIATLEELGPIAGEPFYYGPPAPGGFDVYALTLCSPW